MTDDEYVYDPELETADFFRAHFERRLAEWRVAIPPRFHAAELEDIDDGPVHEGLAEWCDRPAPGNLLLFGPVGVGKTHAAVAAARVRFWRRDESVVFGHVATLLDEMRPGHATPDLVNGLCDCGVLVLDDLAAERRTDWTAERLDLIVNDRWSHGRPIIVSTNLPPDVLLDHLDERLYSRLVDDATALRMTGPDRRRR